MPRYVYCSTVHNSKDLEPTQMPIKGRLDKENVAHIHLEYYAIIKKNEFMSFAGDMDEAGSLLRKLTQEQKTKYRIFPLIKRS